MFSNDDSVFIGGKEVEQIALAGGGVLYRKNSSVTLIDTIQLISSWEVPGFQNASVQFSDGTTLSLNSMGVGTFDPIPSNSVNVNKVTTGKRAVQIIREYYEENVWYIVIGEAI